MDPFETFVQEVGIAPNSRPKATRFGLIEAPGAGLGYMLNLAIYLGLQGGQLIIDGSNRFDLHYVAYGFRRFTPEWERAAERTQIVRAFTCYEMVKALEQVPPQPQPLLVIDMLSTFFDEAVTDRQSFRLVEKALTILEKVKKHRPAILTLSPAPHDQPKRKGLIAQVREAVDVVYVEPQQPERETQLSFIG